MQRIRHQPLLQSLFRPRGSGLLPSHNSAARPACTPACSFPFAVPSVRTFAFIGGCPYDPADASAKFQSADAPLSPSGIRVGAFPHHPRRILFTHRESIVDEYSSSGYKHEFSTVLFQLPARHGPYCTACDRTGLRFCRPPLLATPPSDISSTSCGSREFAARSRSSSLVYGQGFGAVTGFGFQHFPYGATIEESSAFDHSRQSRNWLLQSRLFHPLSD